MCPACATNNLWWPLHMSNPWWAVMCYCWRKEALSLLSSLNESITFFEDLFVVSPLMMFLLLLWHSTRLLHCPPAWWMPAKHGNERWLTLPSSSSSKSSSLTHPINMTIIHIFSFLLFHFGRCCCCCCFIVRLISQTIIFTEWSLPLPPPPTTVWLAGDTGDTSRSKLAQEVVGLRQKSVQQHEYTRQGSFYYRQ